MVQQTLFLPLAEVFIAYESFVLIILNKNASFG